MPSIQYINQTAPFWDFVASMERQGADHPLFGGQQAAGDNNEEGAQSWNPWGGGFPFRPHHPHGRPGGPHHGPPGHPHHGPPPHHRRGPPRGEDVPPPPFTEKDGSPDTVQNEKSEASSGKAPQQDGGSDSEGRGRCGRPGGFRGRGCRGRGGPHGFRGPPWARGAFPFGGFGGFWNENKDEEGDSTFRPDADVFDTESAYVLHLSVPGAKKEDVNVTWNAEKSELAVSGFIARPGDEEFLKTLAMDERKVGLFERKVRLGSLANPAEIDADAITARLEAGILVIEVPKQDRDYVDVKMVTIED